MGMSGGARSGKARPAAGCICFPGRDVFALHSTINTSKNARTQRALRAGRTTV